MMTLVDFFEPSEWANILWLLIIFIGLYSFGKTRIALKNIVGQLLQPKFLIIYGLVFLYMFFIVFGLKRVGFWDLSLLKETCLWLLLGASVLIYNVIETTNVKAYFIDILNDAFKWAVTIEFIIGLYSSSFLFEFFFIPISLLLGLLIGFGGKDEKNIFVVRIIKRFVLLSGSLIFVFRAYQLIVNYKSQFTIDNLKQFMLSPILTLSFVPFLYILFLFVNYQTVFISFNRFLSPSIKIHVKLKLFWSFNFDITGLKRVRDELMRDGIYTKQKINESILNIKKLKSIEKNPPIVNSSKGWSPYEVKDYLKETGLKTGFYTNCDNDWHASSAQLKLDNNILCNNLAYYIKGTEKNANSCKLILNVNNINLREKAHETLLSNSKIIYSKIFGHDMANQIIVAIINGERYDQKFGLINVSISINEWATGKGYHLTFEIFHINGII